jgi:TetR/AcrR family transcriptional regulator, copper-responsive repressor
MGRPKCFNRTDVMERAIPVFWKHGFSGTSVQDLEKATSVNKSGLYSEFKDKEDLFLESLKHYLERVPTFEILTKEPLGWSNIEAFLKMGQTCSGRKGCWMVNTLRELSDLPAAAKQLISDHLKRVKTAIAKNAEAGGSKVSPESLADMVMTFHSGMSMQQNVGVATNVAAERIGDFLSVIRT